MRCHGHPDEIGEVHTTVHVSFPEFQRKFKLRRGWGLQSMDTGREALGERNRRARVSPGSEQQIHLDQHRPRNDHVPAQSGQQLGCELVSTAITTIDCRDYRTCIANDQRPGRAID